MSKTKLEPVEDKTKTYCFVPSTGIMYTGSIPAWLHLSPSEPFGPSVRNRLYW